MKGGGKEDHLNQACGGEGGKGAAGKPYGRNMCVGS